MAEVSGRLSGISGHIGELHGQLNSPVTPRPPTGRQVRAAQTELSSAGAMGPKGAGLAAAAAARLRTAQDALTRAQAEQRKAQHEQQNAQHQLTHWQQRGEQLWHEAQMAAVQATGELEPLSVPAPRLAGAPAAGSLFGGPLLSGGSSGGLPWEVPSTLSGVSYAASVFGGAHTAVHDLASGAGRTLRTGATVGERRIASQVLRQAGGLGKDLSPIARVAGPAGAVANLAGDLANGDSPRRAGLETAGSAVVGGGAAAVVGGGCEASAGVVSAGVATPLCVVAGGAAGALGSLAGSELGKLADELLP